MTFKKLEIIETIIMIIIPVLYYSVKCALDYAISSISFIIHEMEWVTSKQAMKRTESDNV